MTNFLIYTTPIERLSEVKVAVYLLLAIFSSLSYCFFISNYLATLIFNIDGIKSLVTYETIKSIIEDAIRWVTLPYLIGSVFGCFFVELVDRKKQVKNTIAKR